VVNQEEETLKKKGAVTWEGKNPEPPYEKLKKHLTSFPRLITVPNSPTKGDPRKRLAKGRVEGKGKRQGGSTPKRKPFPNGGDKYAKCAILNLRETERGEIPNNPERGKGGGVERGGFPSNFLTREEKTILSVRIEGIAKNFLGNKKEGRGRFLKKSRPRQALKSCSKALSERL